MIIPEFSRYIPILAVDFTQIQKNDNNKSENIISIFVVVRNILAFIGVLILFYVSFQIPNYIYQPINKIEINGNHLISDQTILELLDLDRKQSWFELDPFLLTLRLKELKWIEHATVQKTIPLSVTIQIVEKNPLAVLRTEEQLLLLGKDLHILPYIENNHSWDLPIIVYEKLGLLKVGEKINNVAVHQAIRLMELLESSDALPLSSVSEIHLEEPLNILLVTIPDGIRIKMGYDKYEKKLYRLAASLPIINSTRKEIEYIDLRSNRGTVIKKIKNK